jgi:hypothetical protein
MSKEDEQAEKIDSIAMICHTANKAWCEANGDFSQRDWSSATDWQRDSAIAGVQFKIDNPDAGDDEQHNSWMAAKVSDGWRFGDVKDEEKKTHPCIVPYAELSEFQQKKDALFVAIVKALI